MKRRSADISKLRRSVKRSKLGESIFGSSFTYLKVVLLWSLVLACDFMFNLRIEYFWPLWMFIRSVYDSFRYQGMVFSVFFVLLTVTSDVICYICIPIDWLFFVASTYVWVQYVWHADRGLCFHTLSLWMIFIYIEASLRLKSEKNMSFHIDLARPFAAHCIGYPVVTLGFSVKSYIGYRIRLRRQREVALQNRTLFELMCITDVEDDSVSAQLQLMSEHADSVSPDKRGLEFSQSDSVALTSSSAAATSRQQSAKIPAGSSGITAASSSPASTASVRDHGTPVSRSTADTTVRQRHVTRSAAGGTEAETLSSHAEVSDSRKLYTSETLNTDDCTKSTTKSSTQSSRLKGANAQWYTSTSSSYSCHREKKLSTANSLSKTSSISSAASVTSRDETISKYESDIRKLRSELALCRQAESELRSQLVTHSTHERSLRNQISQLGQDKELLQNKVQSLNTAKQQDKQTISALEKRIADERRLKSNIEQSLQQEKKRALDSTQKVTSECRAKVKELETEVRSLRRDNRLYEEQIRNNELEIESLKLCRDLHEDTETLKAVLAKSQEKNIMLERDLSAETRIKMDLFAVLGEFKRELEVNKGHLAAKEREASDLSLRLGEMLSSGSLLHHTSSSVSGGHSATDQSSFISCTSHSAAPASSSSTSGLPLPVTNNGFLSPAVAHHLEPYPGASSDLYDLCVANGSGSLGV